MTKIGSFSSAAAALAVILMAGASPAAAQQQQRSLFTWNGRVDREVHIVMRGRDVSTRFSNDERGRDRARVDGVLPRAEGVVTVRMNDGRGDVDVVQQPSARNDFTTIVRIRDGQGGDDRYRVAAFWSPTSYGDGRWEDRNGRGAVGRGNGRGRGDDRWDDRNDRGNDRGNGRWGNDGRDGGYGAGALQWRGAVDDVVEIRVQGQRVDYVTRSGATARDVQSRVTGSGLPQRDATVSIRNSQGRGNVWVAQQPSARNGYTAVIRVQDSQGGFGYYDFQASW
ncbi:MAG: hypothetical protein ACXW61_17135 [Gemmatirosa sp.]